MTSKIFKNKIEKKELLALILTVFSMKKELEPKYNHGYRQGGRKRLKNSSVIALSPLVVLIMPGRLSSGKVIMTPLDPQNPDTWRTVPAEQVSTPQVSPLVVSPPPDRGLLLTRSSVIWFSPDPSPGPCWIRLTPAYYAFNSLVLPLNNGKWTGPK